MKRSLRMASRLYPATWRRRYATEFDAMLDQVDADWHDVLDTLTGAIKMQFKIWNLKTITLTFAVIGVVIAAATAFSIRSEYQSTSVLRISAAGDSTKISQRLNDAEQEILSRTSLEEMITGLDLYKAQRGARPLEQIEQDMRTKDIKIRKIQIPGSQRTDIAAFSISFVYSDPKLAQAVTRDLTLKFTKALPRVAGLTSLEILDPPSDPVQPIYPHVEGSIATGLFAGLLLGLTVSYAMRWRIMIVRRPAH